MKKIILFILFFIIGTIYWLPIDVFNRIFSSQHLPFELVNTSGRFWSGDGRLLFLRKDGSNVTLLDQLSWKVSLNNLLASQIKISLKSAHLPQGLVIKLSPRGLSFSRFRLLTDIRLLSGLDQSIKVVGPNGVMTIESNGFSIQSDGLMQGALTLGADNVSLSVLRGIDSIGNYKLEFTANHSRVAPFTINSDNSMLHLSGKGSFDLHQRRISFKGIFVIDKKAPPSIIQAIHFMSDSEKNSIAVDKNFSW